MKSLQADLVEFHDALGLRISDEVGIVDGELRAELIREEARETVEAIERGDLVEAADGIIDLIYVAVGAALTFGIDLQPLWDEVHRSNMAKQGGPIREDGKRLKPEGWKPPRIAELIQAQIAERGARQ